MEKEINTLGETKLIFWSTGKTVKKYGWSVGRQNKNIIRFLELVFFKKIIFCIANTEEKEKPAQNNSVYQFIIDYNNDKCFLVLVILSLFCFISYFFQKAENNRLKKSQLAKILYYYFFVFA